MLRGAHRWLWPCLASRSYPIETVTRVYLTIVDHFEPFHKAKDRNEALSRMDRWLSEYPASLHGCVDASGRTGRHTFCYPIEQYDQEVVSKLAELCQSTGSETEVHLHHHGDTASTLRDKLQKGLEALMQHGLLSRAADGSPRFCFVHGDWALANSHPEGHHCGVPEELRILRELGCIADMTFPSAPSPTQPQRVNDIYYTQNSGDPRTLSQGPSVRCGVASPSPDDCDQLLLVQGVTALNWSRRKWGVLPRLENSDLTLANPPTAERWKLWLHHAPRVVGRPDWAFLKLHTHGATPRNSDMLLGKAMRAFREFLSTLRVPFHYVTAREMVNVIHALEDGSVDPSVGATRYSPPPVSALKLKTDDHVIPSGKHNLQGAAGEESIGHTIASPLKQWAEQWRATAGRATQGSND